MDFLKFATTLKIFFLNTDHYILRKYLISIYIAYYLYAASSTAAVISLKFIKLIDKNYYACL